MNDKRTHVTLVCDRSGSMSAVRDDAQGGVNAFIDGLRSPGDGLQVDLALYDFDNPGDLNRVYQGPIAACPQYKLEPRGNTALLDAIGLTIRSTGEHLKAIPENDRPAKVVFIVQTDGQENASVEYSIEGVRRLIEEQRDTYKWEFVFLGADLAATQGAKLGFQNVTSNKGRGSYSAVYMAAAAGTRAYVGGQSMSMPAEVDTTKKDDEEA